MAQLQTKIRKWGNSHGVILPNEVLDSPHFNSGQKLEIRLSAKSITLTPATPKKKKITLQEMVKGMNKNDRHELIEFGPDLGKEIW